MHRNRRFLTAISYGILTVLVFGFLLYVHVPHRTAFTLPPPHYYYDHRSEAPLDVNQTCHFPNLDPYDPSVWPYVADANPIRCKARQPTLTFVDDDGKLRVNETALAESGYRWSSLECRYQEILRPEGDDEKVAYGEPVAVDRDGVLLQSEFVLVRCTNFLGITVYTDIHAHVIPRPLPSAESHGRRKPSVFLFVIDSMSRLNFIRQLPRTYFYLTRELGAVVLRGMTKVGDNTYPNMVAVLAGRPVYSYPELASHFVPLAHSSSDTFDDWPLVWKNFSRAGYTTAFNEDLPHLSIFNYLAGGFRDPPTDHYTRPFWLAVEGSTLNFLSSNLCCGSAPKHALFLDYERRFLRRYRGRPFFSVSLLTEVSHDFLNQVGAIDRDVEEFLRRARGDLDDAFMVVMGDHGHRMSRILETRVGSVELRMPFFAIRVPDWFRREFPEAVRHLEANAKRLTSMFDVHHTLLDVLDHARDGKPFGTHAHVFGGTTLFGPISASRECPDAGVPYQFCACDRELSVEVDLVPDVRRAAADLVDDINEQLALYAAYCARLVLKDVRAAVFMFRYNGWNESAATVRDLWNEGLDVKLRLTVEASPSDAIFEGLVTVRKNRPTLVARGVSRLNRYGGQASCVPHSVLRGHPTLPLYCYCAT